MLKIRQSGNVLSKNFPKFMQRSFIVLFVIALALPSHGWAQAKVNTQFNKVTLKEAFRTLKSITGVNFVYNNQEINDQTVVSATIRDKSLDEALALVLAQTPYRFERMKDYILITGKKADPRTQPKTITGRITDENGKPMSDVSVWLEGTKTGQTSNAQGYYSLPNIPEGGALVFSYVGYENKRIVVGSGAVIDASLAPKATEVEDVIVTGMFNRRAESFTGSASTFRGDQLRSIGTQNIIASLKSLDPSFIVTDNLAFGSDPNRMPEITMRGRTSISDLQGSYTGNPNQPLFILDGFEASEEKVYDLNMNLVQSVTLLKDAAAKAIYGAKAANGVVVIETILPAQGRLKVSYTGSLDVTAPDLSSYNLCDAAQKLQAEVLAGKYYSATPSTQATLTAQYNELYKEIMRGVDSYWLSQPLRTGVGQKHSLYFDGGDDAMRYSANFSYSRTAGVMKGSDRTTIGGVVSLSYRYKAFTFRNNLSVDYNDANNSPYGSFSQYASMNPYYRIYDENGALIKSYGSNVYNPLYNAYIGMKDRTGYNSFTENFYGEWNAAKNLKVTARVGVTVKNAEGEVFKPATHTDFADIPTWDPLYVYRGSYIKLSPKDTNLAGDLGANYTLNKGNHMLFANMTFSLSENNMESFGAAAVGFPSSRLDFISAGNQYAIGIPLGSEATSRQTGLTTAVNYSYADRYLFDASWRLAGSSQFGANERYGSFWSLGAGWNLHHEAFMEDVTWLTQLKLRGSIGYTGSQNFGAYQAIPSYKYVTDNVYDGNLGMVLAGLANENLKWQRQYDRNVGVDMLLFNLATVRFDYYSNVTSDLLTDITIATSTGFPTYKENMGETLNRGFQVGANFRVYSDNARSRWVNVGVSLLNNKNKVRNISDQLKAYNAMVDAKKEEYAMTKEDLLKFQRDPSTRFEEGQSLSAIWAVRSMGIDPVTGKEIYVKRDGTLTDVWSAADQVVCGDTSPKINGNFNVNVGWGGLNAGFVFGFKYGGQIYNSTLVNKIENVDINKYNVDVRALTERWNTPGVEAKYKGIADYTTTKSTSRFVEDLNELVLSSVNIDYDLSTIPAIKRWPIERIKASFHMNDVFRLSTVKQERGTDYPFARVFSFGLQVNF